MTGGRTFTAAAILCVLFIAILSPGASAHTQETMNVILIDTESRPGNITDPSFVQGNALVFRMRDSTENASMQVHIDSNQNGVFNETVDNSSGQLTYACELDENGSLVNQDCAVSYMFEFLNYTVGNYSYQVERAINGTIVEVWNYSIALHEDVHEEPGTPSVGDCFGSGCDDSSEIQTEAGDSLNNLEVLLRIIMIVAALGSFMLVLSIRGERKISSQPHHEEE